MRRTGIALVSLVLAACAGPALERHEFAEPHMGTEFRVIVFAETAARARAAAAVAFARVAELDAALSDYDERSELRLGLRSDDPALEPIAVSPELFEVLALADEVARASGGAFDVTCGPYVRLWRRARRQAELPERSALAAAAPAVGYERLALDHSARSVRLLARGMRLDLGGIAKGYALDAALAAVERLGLPHALVVGGGELRAGAPPPRERGWRVEVVGLDGPSAFMELARASLSTSGDLLQGFEHDGVRYSHVLDPRSGRALDERRLVTVLGPRGVLTDALATALGVLGPAEGLACLARFPGYEARVLVERGGRVEVHRSAGFPRLRYPAPARTTAHP